MLRLLLPMYAVIGTTVAGILMIAALASGYDTTQPIIIAVIAGFVIGLPVSWVITKKLLSL